MQLLGQFWLFCCDILGFAFFALMIVELVGDFTLLVMDDEAVSVGADGGVGTAIGNGGFAGG